MKARQIETRRGVRVRVFESGRDDAEPLVFLHGVLGLLNDDRFVDGVAEKYHVFAPELPGYGESSGEDLLEDMLDFTLHGWDVVTALGIQRPVLVGHSLGGMIASEMACIAPDAVKRLVLVNPFGLWLDEHPIPDLFSFLPFEFGDVLFHQPDRAAELLVGATDVAEPEALRQFFIDNARRLGTAGKILFPIPNRRLSKRLHRLTGETLIVWGENDRLMPTVYAAYWAKLIPHARVECLKAAGHMLPYEQPRPLAALITS